MEIPEYIKAKAMQGFMSFISAFGDKILIALAIVVAIVIVAGIIIGPILGFGGIQVGGASPVGGAMIPVGAPGYAGPGFRGINVYNNDGVSVNPEAIQQLQLSLESEFNLVAGAPGGRNIGGRYNRTTCRAVTGTYLGYSGNSGNP